MVFFEKSCYVVITGANRGYGKAIALAVLKKLKPGSHLTLHSRNGKFDWLDMSNLRADISVQQIDGDLQKDLQWETKCKPPKLAQFDEAILFFNAGTCGDVTNTILQSTYDLEYLNRFFMENVCQFIPLTRSFINNLCGRTSKLLIVNTSSLFATLRVPKCSLYCASRAARDALVETMCLENPEHRFLNWAPGPLDTHMFRYIKETMIGTETNKEMWQTMTPLDPNYSASILISVLQKNEFENGKHLDIYDVLEATITQ